MVRSGRNGIGILIGFDIGDLVAENQPSPESERKKLKSKVFFSMALSSFVFASPASADEASNIAACAQAVEDRTGQRPNRLDVVYEGNFLAPSVATWPGIRCEVKFDEVVNLTVDGSTLVNDGWPSDQAKELYDNLRGEVEAASATLNSRARILQDELSNAETLLKNSDTDIAQIGQSLRELITEALGR